MLNTTRHSLLASVLAAAAIIGLSPSTLAAISTVSTTVDLTIDFRGATFLGGLRNGMNAIAFDDFEVYSDGYWVTFPGNFLNTGTGTISGNGSMTAGGVASA